VNKINFYKFSIAEKANEIFNKLVVEK